MLSHSKIKSIRSKKDDGRLFFCGFRAKLQKCFIPRRALAVTNVPIRPNIRILQSPRHHLIMILMFLHHGSIVHNSAAFSEFSIAPYVVVVQ